MNTSTKTQYARQAERGSLPDLGKLLQELSSPTAPVKLASFAVADLPDAGDYTGHAVYCSDGANGDPILAFSDGTNWLRSDDGTAVSDTV